LKKISGKRPKRLLAISHSQPTYLQPVIALQIQVEQLRPKRDWHLPVPLSISLFQQMPCRTFCHLLVMAMMQSA